MTALRSFASFDDAFEALTEAVDFDPFRDNHRKAFVCEAAEVEAYERACDEGCCGSIDWEVLVGGKPALVGMNYGH